MKDKLLWSWSSIEDGVRSRDIALPGWLQGLFWFALMALLVFLVVRFFVKLFSPWILIPLVLIVPNFVMARLFRSKLQQKFTTEDWYLRIYNDGIEIKLQDARGFYPSDNIDIASLAVEGFNLASLRAAGIGPVLSFDTLSPSMSVVAPLERMPGGRVRELKRFIASLKQANREPVE